MAEETQVKQTASCFHVQCSTLPILKNYASVKKGRPQRRSLGLRGIAVSDKRHRSTELRRKRVMVNKHKQKQFMTMENDDVADISVCTCS